MAPDKQAPQAYEPRKESEPCAEAGEARPRIYLGRLSDSIEWPEIRPGDRVTVRLVSKGE